MRKIGTGTKQRKRSAPSRGVTILGGTHVVNRGTFIQKIDVTGTPSTPSRRYSNEDPSIEARRRLFHHASTSSNSVNTSKAVSSQAICHSGTRQETIRYLEGHLFDSDTSRPWMVWLNGPAGCGKSTVLRTVCNSRSGLASYFVSSPSNVSSIIPALAYQMVTLVPETAPYVLEAMERDSGLFVVRDVEWQMGELLRDPFLRARGERLGIVIDGLGGVEVLDALVGFVRATEGRVRLLVSTRTVEELDDVMRAQLEQVVRSGECESFAVTDDDARIDLYYHDEFKKIQMAHRFPTNPPWPSAGQYDVLMQRTTSYGFASTVVAYVAGGRDPKRDLERVICVTELSLRGVLLRLYSCLVTVIGALLARASHSFLRGLCPRHGRPGRRVF